MLRTPPGRIPLKSKHLTTPRSTEPKKEHDGEQWERKIKQMLWKRPHHATNELSDEDEKPHSDQMAKKRFQQDGNRKMIQLTSKKMTSRKPKLLPKEEEPPSEVKQEAKDGDAPVETERERSKRLEREKELKKLRKHRPLASFEDAFKDPKSKAKPKYNKKEEKPLFQNGMPVMAEKELQEGRNNIYDFRPLDTITALGKAPLESAYRKNNQNRLNLIKPQTNTPEVSFENPPGKRRPSYLPVLKPTISPIVTPVSQRFPPIVKREKIATQKESNTATATSTLSENPHAYAMKRIAQMRNYLMQLNAITKEMA